MKQSIPAGVVDRTFLVFIPDPDSADGSGKTGLVAANLTVSYTRVETDNDVTVTDATSSLNDLAALTSAHNDWGVKEVSATLAPGLYRIDPADAVFASGAWSSVVYVMITSGLAAASPMEFIFDPLQLFGSVNDAGAAVGDFDGNGGLSSTNDVYNGSVLVFTTGALAGLARQISDYVGASRNLSFSGTGEDADAPFPAAPANGDQFVILGRIGT